MVAAALQPAPGTVEVVESMSPGECRVAAGLQPAPPRVIFVHQIWYVVFINGTNTDAVRAILSHPDGDAGPPKTVPADIPVLGPEGSRPSRPAVRSSGSG